MARLIPMSASIPVFLLFAAVAGAQTIPNIKDVIKCPNSADGGQPYRVGTATAGNLFKVQINAPGAVCNDGTAPVMFVRPAKSGASEPDGPSANRWTIHFLGGSSCDTYEECAARWCGIGQWEGTLMTTKFDGGFRSVDGLVGQNPLNRLGDRNQVLLKYCSSDQWQGHKSDSVLRSEIDSSKAFSLNFQGATIANAALEALIQGVNGMPKLSDATDVLIGGDSAGATGARAHLDRFAARIKSANPNTRVRGQFEATFNPNFNGKQGFPAGDPNDGPYAIKTEAYNRIQVGQRNAQLDDSCVAAHPTAAYLCADDAYLELNHITTPFFQIMDIQDPLMVEGLVDATIATPVQIAQGLVDQIGSLANIRTTAVEKAAITIVPGAVARNCAVHVTYGDDDGFLGRKLRTGPGGTTYSYYEVLWNWLNGFSSSTVIAARPPSTPAIPATDTICDAKAATAPPPPAIATASSASYNFTGAVAPDSIVTTFGTNLGPAIATATITPWPTSLAGTQVQVTDSLGVTRLAPLYYVSPTQISYMVPSLTASGTAQIKIGLQTTSVAVAKTAPGIYSANQAGKGVAAATYIRIRSNGARTEGYLFDTATLADTGVPAAAGDQIYLILYGTGLRGGSATATVGGVEVPVAGPVAQGQYQGLDQINLGPLPLRIGLGQKQIVIRQGDDLANIVTVTFRAP
ncbi:MAG: pectin acetylesterase-family hydrolase [Acidobacteriota bacterium]